MKPIIVLIIVLLLAAGPTLAAQYKLDWKCINSGGLTEQSSNNYAAKITCAQPVAGQCVSNNYKVFLGFWYGTPGISTDVEEIEYAELPRAFTLRQNYPNPFNPTTAIEFAIPRSSLVELTIYNLLGQKVAILVDEQLTAGVYRTTWDGRDQSGNQAASGIYLYRLEAKDYVQTRKMVLLK